MAVRIIEGDNLAALYCSTSMVAFGPVFDDAEQAEHFLDWLPIDSRRYTETELLEAHSIWHTLSHTAGEFVGRRD